MLKFESGNYYYGQFKKGSMHGFGDFVWSSGKSFSGYYVKDLKEGLGLFYWNDPVEIYFGYWLKGYKNGPAIQITSQGKYYSYWENGKQTKLFANKKEGIVFLQNSNNINKRYRKFFCLKLEILVKLYTQKKNYGY